MNIMQEALLKSGLVEEEKIKTIEEEKKKEEREEQKKQEEQLRKQAEQEEKRREQWRQSEQQREQRKQAEQKLAESIFEKMYVHEKKQKFIFHLLWNFLPFNKAKVLEEWNERFRFEKQTCCICNTDLVSRADLFKKAPDMDREMIVGLREMAEGKKRKIADSIQNVFGKKVLLAMCSDSSKALFCMPCCKEFYEWVQSKLFQQDKKINGIIKGLRRKTKNEAT